MAITLLDSVDVDTDSAGVTPDTAVRLLTVWATDFGGGSVSLQASPDGGGTWVTLNDFQGNPLTFSSNVVNVQLPPIGQGMPIKAVLSGSTSPSNVNAVVYKLLA
jgi:hypothetical protein